MNEALQLAPIFLLQAGGPVPTSATVQGKPTPPVEAKESEGDYTTFFTFMILVVALIIGVLLIAKKGYKERVFKSKITSSAEQLYLFLENFALGIIGPHGKKYMPMLATFWLWIFVSNMVGLFMPYTPTADLSSNLGLAIIAVLYVQYEGIRANGPLGHLKHFSGPKLGGALILVSGMIFIIEIISEAMKMVSLSLRLYGNIHGGHEVVSRLNGLGNFAIAGHDVGIPIGALLIPIKLLTVIVQALVFTLLFSVYLGLATHHDEDHGHEEGQGTDGHSQVLEPAH
jgi:F-type H+-transporting ATPase subunit a